MKFAFLASLGLLVVTVGARAQTTAFTYQGRLNDNGAPANGVFEFQFTLHDSPVSTNEIAPPSNPPAVTVSNGLFTVFLDFGSAPFDGSDRWLEIGVRNFGDTNDFVALSPRQFLASTPYAIRAINAANAQIAASLTGTLPGTNLSGTIPDARLSTNVALLNTNVTFAGSVTATQFNGSGAGLTDVPAASLTGTIADVRLSANVALLDREANFAARVSATNFSGDGSSLTNVPGRIFDTIPTATDIQSVPNTGYLATNDTAPVVVTLPAVLRVGEIVRVSGSGAGGWMVAQNAGQTILVGSLLETVGFNWTPRDSSRNWRSAAASADGRKLVAVVNPGFIYTSTNYGVAWTQRATSQNWRSVASSGDGVKLVAVINSGTPYTSTDSGATWSPHGPSAAWTSVASSLDGVKLVGTVGAGPIYTSVNSGANWTARTGNSNWVSVASSADGVKLVAAIQGGRIHTSTNSGVNWTPRDSSRNWVTVASSADGSRLVAAVTSGQIYFSADSGATWTAAASAPSIQWTSVTSSADGSRLAAVYNLGGVYVSTDSGVTWVQRPGLPSLGWTAIAASADASTLVAVATVGQIYVSSQAATTPGTAGYLSGARQAAVELQYTGNGVFIPISSVGTIRFQ